MTYRFGPFALDQGRLELTCDGVRVELEPQVYQLLAHLIAYRDRVVSKDELIDTVWHGRIVSDATLNSRVNSLRRALRDTGKAQAIVRTSPKQGYRFVAEVEETAAGAPPPDAPQSVGNVAAPVADKPSIAVLPFTNLSGDPEQEYFADGIAEDVITALARFRWFFVTARNSSFSYKGQAPDVRKVAAELGVRYVLEGSVRKAADRVRISAQLIDGPTGNHLWAQNYDRDLEDLFALQDEITRTVVGAIEPELGKAERKRSRARRPDSLAAWDLHHRGTAHLYRRTKEDMAEAIRLYDKAIEADLDFAQAHATRAVTHYQRAMLGFSDSIVEDRRNAMRSAQRAVDLDDDDPLAQTALGLAHLLASDWIAAVSAMERALGLNPVSAAAHSALGNALSCVGRIEEAIAHHRIAVDVGIRDPSLGIFMGRLGFCCLRAGQLDDATHWSEQALRHNANVWLPYAQLAWVYLELGRQGDASTAVDEMRDINPELRTAYVEDIVAVFEPDPDQARSRVDDLRALGLPD